MSIESFHSTENSIAGSERKQTHNYSAGKNTASLEDEQSNYKVSLDPEITSEFRDFEGTVEDYSFLREHEVSSSTTIATIKDFGCEENDNISNDKNNNTVVNYFVAEKNTIQIQTQNSQENCREEPYNSCIESEVNLSRGSLVKICNLREGDLVTLCGANDSFVVVFWTMPKQSNGTCFIYDTDDNCHHISGEYPYVRIVAADYISVNFPANDSLFFNRHK